MLGGGVRVGGLENIILIPRPGRVEEDVGPVGRHAGDRGFASAEHCHELVGVPLQHCGPLGKGLDSGHLW